VSTPACEFRDTCWLTAVCQRHGVHVETGERSAARACPSETPAPAEMPRGIEGREVAYLVAIAALLGAIAWAGA
jgi:hypothetical protein